MYVAAHFQVRDDDHQRQMAWPNAGAEQFSPQPTPARVRETLAQALFALATRLAPATSLSQPRTHLTPSHSA